MFAAGDLEIASRGDAQVRAAKGGGQVFAGAAWALSERTGLGSEARQGLADVLDDPVRIVRLHAALGLGGVEQESLEPRAREAFAAAARWVARLP